MSIFVKDGKRFNITTYDRFKYGRNPWTDPEFRAANGVTEVPDPTPPEDFSDDIYYVTSQDTEPFVIWTRKSDEQIAQVQASRAATTAQQYLDSTDYLFCVDRHSKLLADEPERAAEIAVKREEAREAIRLWKSMQPVMPA